jgi:hypothetical protein
MRATSLWAALAAVALLTTAVVADMTNEADCSMECTLDYAPVCGSNGRVYSNFCALQVAACRLGISLTKVTDGECPASTCAEACTDEYSPVCATDGVTYSNACELNKRACQSFAPLEVLHTGACVDRDCPDYCTERFAPVCTSGGITFPNLCELFVTRCRASALATPALEVAHGGRCLLEDCPDACVKIMAPVCGNDGQTYENECELTKSNCAGRRRVLVASAGACVAAAPVDESCAAADCGPNEVCVPAERECFTTPCPQYDCVPADTPADPPVQEDNCDTMCPMVYVPICGSNMVTYSNECELEVESCRQRASGFASITVLHDGECRGDELAASSITDLPGFIVAVVFVSLLVVASIVAVLFFVRRQRTQAARRNQFVMMVNEDDASLTEMVATSPTTFNPAAK